MEFTTSQLVECLQRTFEIHKYEGSLITRTSFTNSQLRSLTLDLRPNLFNKNLSQPKRKGGNDIVKYNKIHPKLITKDPPKTLILEIQNCWSKTSEIISN